jgi:hypothetical protein
MKLILLAALVMTTADIPRLNLTPRSTTQTQADGLTGYQGDLKCDDQGNIYLRPSSANDTELQAPIQKLDKEGKQAWKITWESVADLKGVPGTVVDFTTDRFGTIYVLMYMDVKKPSRVRQPPSTLYVVRYKSDGRFEGAAGIDAPEDFQSMQFERFQSGEYLISGAFLPSEEPGAVQSARTGLFESSGALIKWIDTKEKFKNGAHGLFERSDAIALGTSMAVSGDDGNVWLLRPGEKPQVFAISAAGEIVHHYTATPPPDGGPYVVAHLSVGKGRFMVAFSPQGPDPIGGLHAAKPVPDL